MIGVPMINADEINKYECATAILPYYIRKLPDIAESNRGSGCGQDEAQSTSPEPPLIIVFGLHTNGSIFLR
jgi:hypothetical protein